MVREMVRDEISRLMKASALSHYSQREGERPPGVSKDNYLRICREHAIELGVVRRGKARIVPIDRWDAWLAAANKPHLRIVRAEPAASGAAGIRNALGLMAVRS